MAGVQADAEPLAAAGELDQPRQLLERAPERPAGAGGVLEVQRAVLGLRERLARSPRRARSSAAPTSPPSFSAEPGCSTTAVRAQRRARPQRGRQRRAATSSRISASSEAQLSR